MVYYPKLILIVLYYFNTFNDDKQVILKLNPDSNMAAMLVLHHQNAFWGISWYIMYGLSS